MDKLYLFDEATRLPTEVENVELPENYKTLGPKKLWEALGRTGPVLGSVYPAPEDDTYVFIEGWIRLQELTNEWVADFLVHGRIGPAFVIHHGFAESVMPILIRRTVSTLNNLGSEADYAYAEAERSTWGQQIEEAKAIIENKDAETTYLKAIADEEGRDIEELALSVLDKAENYAKSKARFLAKANAVRRTVKGIEGKADAASLEAMVNIIQSIRS